MLVLVVNPAPHAEGGVIAGLSSRVTEWADTACGLLGVALR